MRPLITPPGKQKKANKGEGNLCFLPAPFLTPLALVSIKTERGGRDRETDREKEKEKREGERRETDKNQKSERVRHLKREEGATKKPTNGAREKERGRERQTVKER